MKLNVHRWKEFTLNRVFTLKGGFYNKKPEHSKVGNIPFLASTENNNGVTEYYCIDDIRCWDKVGEPDNSLDKKLFDGNCIAVTVNGSVCNAFYQKKQFSCSHDITALYLKKQKMNVYIGQFISTVIMMDKYRWNYGRKPHDVLKFGESIIKLPIQTDDGGTPLFDEKKTFSNDGYIPDWEFMEQYIKTLNCEPLTTKVDGKGILDLNIEKWEEFCLGDIFDIKKGKRLTSEDQTDGDTPYIGAIDSNNGVANYIGQKAIHDGNTISLSYNGSVGEAFYQPKPFWATDDVNVLYFRHKNNVGFNKYIALFFCAVLRQEKYRYSYGRKWVLDSMRTTTIKLPVNNGQPDYAFMERYMRALPYGDRI